MKYSKIFQDCGVIDVKMSKQTLLVFDPLPNTINEDPIYLITWRNVSPLLALGRSGQLQQRIILNNVQKFFKTKGLRM